MNYVLFNPHAGNSSYESKLKKLNEIFTEDSKIIDMTELSDYKSFIASLSDDDFIVLCGGDGTINRFVNDTSDIEIKNDILYYPLGTGNDFLKDISDKAIDKPISIKKYISDLPSVEVNSRVYRFINGVGFGVDGYCCEVGDALKAKSDKPVNYTAIAIKGLLFHFKPKNAIITVDGVRHEFKKVWIAPTMNGKYYGGGMMPAPEQARLNPTGELSVTAFHGSGKLKTLMIFPSIFKGEHVKNTKYVSVLKGHEISVEFDSPCALQIDGETILGVTKYTAKSSKMARVAK